MPHDTPTRRMVFFRAAPLLICVGCALIWGGCISNNPSGRPIGLPEQVTTVSLCPRCLKPCGEGHICGLTEYCKECGVDCGSGHICGLTHFCSKCRREVGIYHVCGVTKWCETCKREVGPGHRCGKTRFCRECGIEVEGPHAHAPPDDADTPSE